MNNWKWVKRQIKQVLDSPQMSIYEKKLNIMALLNYYIKIDNKK